MALVFIMKWAIALTLLYSLYGLFLSKETFYTVNRFVLLSIIVISAILPFTHFHTDHQSVLNGAVETISQSLIIHSQEVQASDTALPYTAFFILGIYTFGVFVMMCRYLKAIISIYNIIRKSRREGDYYVNDSVESPFSWFNYIVISSSDLRKNGNTLLAHERVHAQRCHSYDLLFCDICCCVQWFNPFMWMLKEDLCAVHEYEADYGAIHCEGINYHDYQMLLIDKATEKQMPPIVNSINRGSLRHRLKQMYRKPSARVALLKIVYIIPLSMFVMYAFASPETTRELRTIVSRAETSLVEAERKIINSLSVETNSKENTLETDVNASTENENVETPATDEVIINPDTPPVFENGIEDFYEYIYTYRHYPRIAFDNDVSGLVVIYFVVETDGSISGVEMESSDATSHNPDVAPEILESCKEAFEEETIRIVETMPKWKPGTHNGTVARCAFSTVIRF